MFDQRWIGSAGCLHGGVVGASGPLLEQRAAKLAEFFDDHLLGFMGIHPGTHLALEAIHDGAEAGGDNRVGPQLFEQLRLGCGDRGG